MTVLLEQIRSNPNFHLGGSRRMNQKYPDYIKIKPTTDYDFYCADTEENRKFLNDNNFKLVDARNKNYWDDLLIDMYFFGEDKPKIEVLIRKDIDVYKRAFESISKEVFMYQIWKSSPYRIESETREDFSNRVRNFMNDRFQKIQANYTTDNYEMRKVLEKILTEHIPELYANEEDYPYRISDVIERMQQDIDAVLSIGWKTKW